MYPTPSLRETTFPHPYSVNKSGDAFHTTGLAVISLLLAATPTILWYHLRLQDGGGEYAGLVPFAAAIWFGFRDRKGFSLTSPGVWIGTLLLFLQAATLSFLPAMIRALLMLAAVISVLGIWKKPGIFCLLVLSLPWIASLDFFLGYPLRLLTSINTSFLLETLGMDVTRSGAQLQWEGRVVGVDAACSGMKMLWSTGFLTSLLATIFSLNWRKLILLGFAALALALVGNSLRATMLFFPEAGIFNMPHLLHPTIGLFIAGGCFLILMKLARRLSTKVTPHSGEGRLSHQSASLYALVFSALLVLCVSLFPAKNTVHTLPTPPSITSFQGAPVTQISLTPSEEKFYRSFPGSVTVYEGSGFKLIVRQVNRATRKLHPANHCLRAEGFRIGEKSVIANQWLSYQITRNGEKFQVRERITESINQRAWPEISAWYWHALFHPGAGPWEAMTVIEFHSQ